MNTALELRYYKLMEELLSLTQIVNQQPDIPRIESILNEISAMFRLCKGITHFYRNPGEEKSGEGEVLCSYDTGREGKPVHTVRFVTRLMSITTSSIGLWMRNGIVCSPSPAVTIMWRPSVS